MIFFQDATIEGVAIHKVGNKALDEFYILSNTPLDLKVIDDDMKFYLMNFFCRPFAKAHNVYNFFHSSNELLLNEVYHYTSKLLKGSIDLQSASELLAKHLYEVSNHPKLKGSEFYVVHFKSVQFEGEFRQAIGLFKSDNREMYLKVSTGENILMEFTEAINTQQLDQAVLIVESDAEEGYEVVLSEIKNNMNLQFWKDDFLQLKARNDNYQHTANLMKLTNSFITYKLDDVFELDKMDKIDLLNKTVKFFKEHESLDLEEFEQEVIGSNQVISLFKEYRRNFEDEYEIEVPQSFTISDKAVKKAQAQFKSVIKLDKNFHLWVHGKRDLLESGFDEERGMNYYKIYYNNED